MIYREQRISSDKSYTKKQQELKPYHLYGQNEIYLQQNQMKCPQIPHEQALQCPQMLNYSFESHNNKQLKTQNMKKSNVKQINMNADDQIQLKKNIKMINQQSNLYKHLNENIQNPKFQELLQQQNNSKSFYLNKQQYLQQIHQKASRPQQIINKNQYSEGQNKGQNMQSKQNQELRKPQNQIQGREIQEKQQVNGIKISNEQNLNEYNKTRQAQEKKIPKKQFEPQLRHLDNKEKDYCYEVDRQLQVVQQQDQQNNQEFLLNMNHQSKTQDSENEQNNILDSNISLLTTFNFTCFDCNLKIESVCIQTPCQHSFHKTCINQIMKKSLLQNGFQINCKCTEKLPQYFIRNHNQELFHKLLEQQIQQIEKNQTNNNKQNQAKEGLVFHATELLKEIQHNYETGERIDILKCYYLK